MTSVDEDDIFVVEQLLEKKVIDGVAYYRIRWKGYGEADDTWEPESNVIDVELIAQFNARSQQSGGQNGSGGSAYSLIVDDDDDDDDINVVTTVLDDDDDDDLMTIEPQSSKRRRSSNNNSNGHLSSSSSSTTSSNSRKRTRASDDAESEKSKKKNVPRMSRAPWSEYSSVRRKRKKQHESSAMMTPSNITPRDYDLGGDGDSFIDDQEDGFAQMDQLSNIPPVSSIPTMSSLVDSNDQDIVQHHSEEEKDDDQDSDFMPEESAQNSDEDTAAARKPRKRMRKTTAKSKKHKGKEARFNSLESVYLYFGEDEDFDFDATLAQVEMEAALQKPVETPGISIADVSFAAAAKFGKKRMPAAMVVGPTRTVKVSSLDPIVQPAKRIRDNPTEFGFRRKDVRETVFINNSDMTKQLLPESAIPSDLPKISKLPRIPKRSSDNNSPISASNSTSTNRRSIRTNDNNFGSEFDEFGGGDNAVSFFAEQTDNSHSESFRSISSNHATPLKSALKSSSTPSSSTRKRVEWGSRNTDDTSPASKSVSHTTNDAGGEWGGGDSAMQFFNSDTVTSHSTNDMGSWGNDLNTNNETPQEVTNSRSVSEQRVSGWGSTSDSDRSDKASDRSHKTTNNDANSWDSWGSSNQTMDFFETNSLSTSTITRSSYTTAASEGRWGSEVDTSTASEQNMSVSSSWSSDKNVSGGWGSELFTDRQNKETRVSEKPTTSESEWQNSWGGTSDGAEFFQDATNVQTPFISRTTVTRLQEEASTSSVDPFVALVEHRWEESSVAENTNDVPSSSVPPQKELSALDRYLTAHNIPESSRDKRENKKARFNKKERPKDRDNCSSRGSKSRDEVRNDYHRRKDRDSRERENDHWRPHAREDSHRSYHRRSSQDRYERSETRYSGPANDAIKQLLQENDKKSLEIDSLKKQMQEILKHISLVAAPNIVIPNTTEDKHMEKQNELAPEIRDEWRDTQIESDWGANSDNQMEFFASGSNQDNMNSATETRGREPSSDPVSSRKEIVHNEWTWDTGPNDINFFEDPIPSTTPAPISNTNTCSAPDSTPTGGETETEIQTSTMTESIPDTPLTPGDKQEFLPTHEAGKIAESGTHVETLDSGSIIEDQDIFRAIFN